MHLIDLDEAIIICRCHFVKLLILPIINMIRDADSSWEWIESSRFRRILRVARKNKRLCPVICQWISHALSHVLKIKKKQRSIRQASCANSKLHNATSDFIRTRRCENGALNWQRLVIFGILTPNKQLRWWQGHTCSSKYWQCWTASGSWLVARANLGRYPLQVFHQQLNSFRSTIIVDTSTNSHQWRVTLLCCMQFSVALERLAVDSQFRRSLCQMMRI
jgi:hypothetical protein